VKPCANPTLQSNLTFLPIKRFGFRPGLWQALAQS
jgi:hypothetical protein